MLESAILRCALILSAFASAVTAQLPTGDLVVATQLPGAPATGLLLVSQAGAITPLSRFPSDTLPPRAVTADPINRDLLLAVAIPTGSRVVRLSLLGTAIVSETIVGDVPGVVRDLAVAHTGDVYLAIEAPNGGIWRLPRRGGGPATLAVPVVDPSHMTTFGLSTSFTFVAESGTAGPPPRDLRVHQLDIATGQFYLTQSYPGFQPAEVTGTLDLPTAIPRTVFTHPDGTVSLSELFRTPVPIQLPNFGPGSVRTLVGAFGFFAVTVGGQNHPFVKAIPGIPFTGAPMQWTILAGPLPGDPVDMDVRLIGGTRVQPWGEGCGASPGLFWFNDPQLGSQTFAVGVSGATPGIAAFFGLGYSEAVTGSGAPLPFPLPSGCLLLIDPEAVFFHVLDGTGSAVQPLPIPQSPTLVGLLAHAQWFLATGQPFATTPALAIEIGR